MTSRPLHHYPLADLEGVMVTRRGEFLTVSIAPIRGNGASTTTIFKSHSEADAAQVLASLCDYLAIVTQQADTVPE